MSGRSGDTPLLIVGGFATPSLALGPLARFTRELGYRPTVVCPHVGLDCSERSYALVLETARQIMQQSGAAPWLVAHSRGGQFCRVLATRHPDLLCGLIALGTPFAPGLGSVNRYTQARIKTLALFGSAGIPNLVTLDCLGGRCCQTFWGDLASPWPTVLPFHAIYAERDRVVRWRDALDPAARTAVVPGTHLSLLWSRASFDALALGLAGTAYPKRASLPETALSSG